MVMQHLNALIYSVLLSIVAVLGIKSDFCRHAKRHRIVDDVLDYSEGRTTEELSKITLKDRRWKGHGVGVPFPVCFDGESRAVNGRPRPVAGNTLANGLFAPRLIM